MADYQYIDATGVIIPDTATIIADVGTEYQNAFGEDLSLEPNTPQGLLIATEANARSEVLRNNAALANQINPNIAGGVFLDAISALTGLQRQPATRTRVPGVLLGGRPNTIVPAGVRASIGTGGDLFESVGAVILDLNGNGVIDFQGVEFGPVAAPVGGLDTVVDTVLGWETVANPNAATLGTFEQSDASLRRLRRITLALQGVSLVEAITSSLNDVPNVLGIQFRENISGTQVVIDGVTLKPHSVWAVVDGGTDAAVAAALLENKSNGAGWNGPVTVEVLEPASGQTYPVQFQRPTYVPTLARFTVRRGNSTSDPDVAIRNAVLAYVDGQIEGEDGFRVGVGVSPFELAAAINYFEPGLFVRKVEVATLASGVYQTTELPLQLWEKATISSGSITVVVE